LVIQDLVSEDQVGFIKGRNISSMIRLIDDTVDYLNVSNQPGILFALDYKAAFDTISKDYLIWAFKKFNFGDNFLAYVNVLLRNSISSINHMGWLSEYFNVECGVRQGCPFSPQAFVLALELLAIRLRANAHIKGIHLPFKVNTDQSVKVLLYADDVTLLVQDLQDLKNALTLVTYFSKFSGLAMNRLKSEAM
jgi:hypothetical protein